jgi:hypothetical protein
MLALRPEFLPMMGSRTAVNAQNDSAFDFFSAACQLPRRRLAQIGFSKSAALLTGHARLPRIFETASAGDSRIRL